MIDFLSIVETDKVNHTVDIDIVKLVVEIESFGMNADELDKETGSSDGLQPKQADMSCVHALNKLYLHEIHVVPSTHEADQCGRLSAPERIALSPRVVIDKFVDSSSNSYSTSQISTSNEIDYDSPEPPKSLLKWYHYLLDEYKDNGRFWGLKSRCNESDVKPSWKDIKKAKACMLAKAQASKASFKAKVEACGSKVKVEARGSKEIIEISSDSSEDRKGASKATTPIFYGPSTQGLLDAYGYNTVNMYQFVRNTNQYVPVTRCVLRLANLTTWDEIGKKMRSRKSKTCADKAKGKRKVRDTKDIRIGSNTFLKPYPHIILNHITDFDLAVNISQSFNWEDFLKYA
nr:hypothetical protein [Tanacetum cinerariifolium]